ncbi:hypothetical protein B0H17DRAFT_1169055 [Mycena rosella]|uniref:Uncharacterized protein n=1 Tax=Mycena rosella TaxID=1033263 RepID=A0AAD7DHI8_MYCRO|nr:hypothetical protein B0H17DRAFT_1169055 [Mycena rosella]
MSHPGRRIVYANPDARTTRSTPALLPKNCATSGNAGASAPQSAVRPAPWAVEATKDVTVPAAATTFSAARVSAVGSAKLRNVFRKTPETPCIAAVMLDADERLSIDLFLSVTNTSMETYNAVRDAILRCHPDDNILSYHSVKKLVSVLSGVFYVTRDMCVNTCIAYTGPFHSLSTCPYCAEPRYYPKRPATKIPRKQFNTILIGPQLQALRRSPEGAAEMRYREQLTRDVLEDLDDNDDVKSLPYTDFFHGNDYVDAVRAGKIKAHDNVLMISVDGAQLYRNKASDSWIATWLILDRSPGTRYKKKAILLIFIYTGLYHLAALQREGLKVWDAIEKKVLDTNPFLALATADGPGMACLNGCVGHHGKRACRLYCRLIGRHKVGGSHYYPVRFKPDQYTVSGCDHEDVHLGPLLDGFDSEEASTRYKANVNYVGAAPNKSQYEKHCLETGISKPTIFSGLPSQHMLGVPDCFGLDFMHAPALNLTDLLPSLWRGTFDNEKSDDKKAWPWAVLTGDVWKRHGQAVADLTRYIPGSFGRPPRNPAEKINSGYKAWEFLLYFFGAGPALLYGVLPLKYWTNYCKVVRGIRILLQEKIFPKELLESHQKLSQFSDEFEHIYVQRRADRIHFVRPIIHTLSHMPGETARKGPGNIYSQWALERTIGNLGEEIKQHSNPYANLSERAIRRCQVNALKAVIPDLEPDEIRAPRGSIDIGEGYILLKAQDSCRRPIRPCEEEAIRVYIENEFGFDTAKNWVPLVVRWARARLPDGETIRSLWKEEHMAELRTARHVKVLFYMILEVDEEERYLAVASFFGEPEPHLLNISSGTYWSAQHARESDVRAIEITSITALVTMAPDHQYRLYRADGSEHDRWYLMEKPGGKVSSCTSPDEDMEG